MEKVLSTRVEETVIDELEAESKISGKKKGRIIEDAIRSELKKMRSERLKK